MSGDKSNTDSQKSEAERSQQVQRVSNKIEHERRQQEQLEGVHPGTGGPDVEPEGMLPGPHARVLDPKIVTLTDNEGRQDDFLSFKVILPDNSYDRLITEYPVPEPGPILTLLYQFVGVDPAHASPEDLFREDIPVRPIKTEPAKGRWVLDLPPGIPTPAFEEPSNKIQELIQAIPQGSDFLYKQRRKSEMLGFVTWKDELFPRKRWFPSNTEKEKVKDMLEEVASEDHIAHILSTGPRLTVRGKLGFFSLPISLLGLAGVSGGPYVGQVRTLGILLLVLAFIGAYVFTTYSVRRRF